MISYEEFKAQVIKAAEDRYGADQIKVLKQNKANLGETDAICLNQSNSVVKTLNITRAYNDVIGGYDIDDAIESIIKAMGEPIPEDFTIPNTVPSPRDTVIRRKIVNAQKNADFLQDKPHRIIADLAIYYVMVVMLTQNDVGTVSITNNMTDGLTEEDLYMRSDEEGYITSMFELFTGGRAKPISEAHYYPEDDLDMYILTNKDYICGASQMVNERTLSQVCEALGEESIIMLPSSVNECLIRRGSENEDINELQNIVKDVNRHALPEKDFLADSVYSFSPEDGIKLLTATDTIAA